jgi:hypothetical protein
MMEPDYRIIRTPVRRIGVMRLSATLGLGGLAIFVLCWLGTFVPYASPTHAFIALFTNAPVNSVAALVQGALWSFLLGALSGALLAALYNLFGGLDSEAGSPLQDL